MQLFNTFVVNPDGKIFPCCLVTDKSNTFGDLLTESIEDIWNNDKYEYSRSLFRKQNNSGQKIETICFKCNNFRKYDRKA
jgi:radical SAM protein with 4Fe4S-binding SPASM domain